MKALMALAVMVMAVIIVLGTVNRQMLYGWFLFFVLWGIWAPLAGYAQHRRGGWIRKGILVGLFFGPVGLLVANYSGGKSAK